MEFVVGLDLCVGFVRYIAMWSLQYFVITHGKALSLFENLSEISKILPNLGCSFYVACDNDE